MNWLVLNYSVYGNAKDVDSNRLLLDAFRARDCRAALREVAPGQSLDARATHALVRFDLRSDADWSYIADLLRALETAGVRVVPSSDAFGAAEDKWLTHARLAAAGVATPPTHLACDAPGLAGPLIAKPRVGWGGHGTQRFERAADWDRAPQRRSARHIVQPFLAHDATLIAWATPSRLLALLEDPGCLTEDRRSRARPIAADAPLEAMACRALAAVGLPVGTVDLLRTAAEPLALEVNASPCLTYPHLPTLDLAGFVVDALLTGGHLH